MSSLSDVKKRIVEEDKIIELFEALECEHITMEQNSTLITAQLPERFNSSNKRAVQCRINNSLSCSIRNRSDFEGDIFNLVSYLHFNKNHDELQSDINNAKTFICDLFGWHDLLKGNVLRKKSIIHELKKRAKRNKKKIKLNLVRDEEILKQNFIQIPNRIWEEEGISTQTQRVYGIGFDILTSRITVPIRNKFGQLVGVKGRLLKDEDVNSHEPKYIYLYKCYQSQELFNFHMAQEEIKKKKEVIIVEGEKSCMKFYEHGIYNVVALGSSDISNQQRQLLYSLGMDITIVLAYDNDKTVEEIFKVGSTLNGRKVFYIYDVDNLLPPKSAPIDGGIDIWRELYNENKFELTEEEDE